jgi:hypothetical protein
MRLLRLSRMNHLLLLGSLLSLGSHDPLTAITDTVLSISSTHHYDSKLFPSLFEGSFSQPLLLAYGTLFCGRG